MDTEAGGQRALEILDSVKVIFAAKGFDGTSMQDMARAAGMSAGNFYRYFPSKNALIEALIERELSEVRQKFAEVINSPTPLDSFRALLRHRIETVDETDGPIWAEIEAAAARRPEFAELLGRMEDEITRNLVAVFARIAGLKPELAERRFAAHAHLIIMLVHGVSMRCAARAGMPNPPADRDLAALVGRTVEHILAEVSASGAAPAPAKREH